MRPKILYVDDDDANLTVFDVAFSSEFSVLTANSGATALELLSQHHVGVLLVDQRMPGMTGVEVAEAVRATHPNVVRLLITAYSDLSAAIAAINRGQVRRYLQKPWSTDELRMVLRESIELFEMREKTRELERRLLETERVYALGVVASGLAHELRNPLACVMGNFQLAQGRLNALREAIGNPRKEAQLASFMKQLEENLVDGVQNAERMVEVVRSVELPTRHQGDHETVDLREVARLAVRTVQGELHRRATISLEIGEAGLVRGSRHRLGQVVLNLLVNALEAFPEGKRNENRVILRLAAGDPGKAPSGPLPGSSGANEPPLPGAPPRAPNSRGEVILTVEDNGPGIPPQAMARIFDPFFTTKRVGGTGLGLAISRKIVEEHGGTLTVAAAEPRGTQFIVRLPTEPTGAK